MKHPWMGEKFSHSPEPVTSRVHHQYSFKKSIIPTKTVFQMGLHVNGACKLEAPFNGGCSNSTEFCYKPSGHVKKSGEFHFDEVILADDIKSINAESEGVLYHIMLYRFHQGASNTTNLNLKNDYALKYFPQTLAALKKRKLDLLIIISDIEIKHRSVADSWIDYDIIWESRYALGSLFPGSGVKNMKH